MKTQSKQYKPQQSMVDNSQTSLQGEQKNSKASVMSHSERQQNPSKESHNKPQMISEEELMMAVFTGEKTMELSLKEVLNRNIATALMQQDKRRLS